MSPDVVEELDILLTEFCDELDRPGSDPKKRRKLGKIAELMVVREVDPYWKARIQGMVEQAFRVFDLSETSVDDDELHICRTELSGFIAAVAMHIRSLRPQRYDGDE
jgi:hypothetical protein